ncbi:MAG: hypothetical protein R6V19_14980 [Armatimonadota bacterium]
MKTAQTSAVFVIVVFVATALFGCSPPGPEGVAQAFVNAMKSRDTRAAAKHWNYITTAREQNENWDEIPEGQRNLIISKLQESRAKELEYWTEYFDPETTIVEVTDMGDKAEATLRGGRAGVLKLINIDDRWYVDGLRQ